MFCIAFRFAPNTVSIFIAKLKMQFCGHIYTSACTKETWSILCVCECRNAGKSEKARVVCDLVAQKIIFQHNNNSHIGLRGALHISLSQRLLIDFIFWTFRIRSSSEHAGKINFQVEISSFKTTLFGSLMDNNTGIKTLKVYSSKSSSKQKLVICTFMRQAQCFLTSFLLQAKFLLTCICRGSSEPQAQNAPQVGKILNCTLVIKSNQFPGFGSNCFKAFKSCLCCTAHRFSKSF